jgi:3-deoxy-D-manno-octulosonic-acid transferase
MNDVPESESEMGQQQDRQRYLDAMHAVQTGVDYEQQRHPDTPKHLRVGINSALITASAIARLLIDKGVFTEEEYWAKLVVVAEEEKTEYEKRLSERYGIKVDLA